MSGLNFGEACAVINHPTAQNPIVLFFSDWIKIISQTRKMNPTIQNEKY